MLIIDEVQTGLGRTGAMWASDYYDIEPERTRVRQGRRRRAFPLAGVLAKRRFAKFLAGDDQLTFGQFPISIAAGLATVRAVIADDLCTTAAEHGRYATERLLEMQRRHPLIGDVRSPGLMVSDRTGAGPRDEGTATAEAHAVFVKAQERGVILGESRYAGLGNLIKINRRSTSTASCSPGHSTCSTTSSPRSRPSTGRRACHDRHRTTRAGRPSPAVRPNPTLPTWPHSATANSSAAR